MHTIDFDRLVNVLQRYPNVLAAWLFGSAREGVVRQNSDIDLGVLFASKPTLEELANLRADLTEALHFEEVDLIALNDADALLRFEAVSGRRLFVRDLEMVAAFVSLTAREAEDANALVQRGLDYLKEILTSS